MATTKWNVADGAVLSADIKVADNKIEITFQSTVRDKGWILHWGYTSGAPEQWLAPPQPWVESSPNSVVKKAAVQTAFVDQDGVKTLKIVVFPVNGCQPPKGLVFVLARPEKNKWYKDRNGKNFFVALPEVFGGVFSPSSRNMSRRSSSNLSRAGSLSRLPSYSSLNRLPSQTFHAPPELTTAIDGEEKFKEVFQMVGGTWQCEVQALVRRKQTDDGRVSYVATLLTQYAPDVVVHWAVSVRFPKEWSKPSLALYEVPNSAAVKNACETVMTRDKGQWKWARLRFSASQDEDKSSHPVDKLPVGVVFVLREKDDNKWLKDSRNGNAYLPLRTMPAPAPTPYSASASAAPPSVSAMVSQVLEQQNQLPVSIRVSSSSLKDSKDLGEFAQGLIDDIAGKELGAGSWTLMHRFYMARDMIGRIVEAANKADYMEGWECLAVWLRYSAMRQLDWQRKYHTKPRELSQSQDALTQRLTDVYKKDAALRWLLRLVIAAVGRGGTSDMGQRIRDEILVIMHRNRDWKHGSFMEEWHQKLHNNTSPDDVVIAEAYLAFLRANGDLKVFYASLAAGGVSRERMASYEQPIHADPNFVPHINQEHMHDIDEYLKLLRAVHLGTDLSSAINLVKGGLDGGLAGQLQGLVSKRADQDPVTYLSILVDCRHKLQPLINSNRGEVRDLIFLDIALEAQLRVVVEGAGGLPKSNVALHVALLFLVLRSVAITQHDDPEMQVCVREFAKLASPHHVFDTQWFLRAKAVVDRITRAIQSQIDLYQASFQASANAMGRRLRVAQFAMVQFTEELVRGSHLFALSLALRRFNPIVRQGANLGAWQIISPGKNAASGTLLMVDSLKDTMQMPSTDHKVVVAFRVGGDEDPPDWVAAVITPDTPDVLSHVAVRARNVNLLFVTCYDPEILDKLRLLEGQNVAVKVGAGGDVDVRAAAPGQAAATQAAAGGQHGDSSAQHMSGHEAAMMKLRLANSELELHHDDAASAPPLNDARYVIQVADFTRALVGSKSFNTARLHQLADRLPDWIHIPLSCALPFGVCERVLSDPLNGEVNAQYEALMKQLPVSTGDGTMSAETSVLLQRLQEVLLTLTAPEALVVQVREALATASLNVSEADWAKAWRAIKRVWASKWNDRAFSSRIKFKMPHFALLMAVLVQQVVDAEYAFVIHTTDPMTGNASHLYAEVVCGMGETLVGNYPGRAFSFRASKTKPYNPTVLSYPSKATALYGAGLIFRSDSNGEDLEGYAGAGLYDSHLMEEAREKTPIEYADERLVWDTAFQQHLMDKITDLGVAIERAWGMAQDIEGCLDRAGKWFVVQTRPQV